MSRRVRALVLLLTVTLAWGVAACSSPTAPQVQTVPHLDNDTVGSNT